jgi:tripartite-type tricarboxylate transporter receptor subunit TctC
MMMVPVANPQRARLKLLAVANAERFALVPDVPTLRDQGFDLAADAWIGLLGAPGTPPRVAEAIHAVVARVVQTEGFQQTLRANGFTSLGHDPTAFARFLAGESGRCGEVVRRGNIRVES